MEVGAAVQRLRRVTSALLILAVLACAAVAILSASKD